MVREASGSAVRTTYRCQTWASPASSRKDQVADAFEELAVATRRPSSIVVPRVEMWELQQKEQGLDRVETCRVADELVPVLLALAVLAQRAHALRELGVVGHQRAGVAHGAEVLPG